MSARTVHDHEEAHGSRKGYWIGFALSAYPIGVERAPFREGPPGGFALSAVLTAIPFWLVMTMPLSNQATALIIMAFAAVQMIVHMIFFLHMNRRAEGGWSVMALLFTVVIVVIALSGSLWVMYHMNANMMPTQDMSQMG